jgi:hypothetical protein
MMTTAEFQSQPNYYRTSEESRRRRREQTNPKYEHFTQSMFHAGDEEQFYLFRDTTNGDLCSPSISPRTRLFEDIPVQEWTKYNNLCPESVTNTFNYMFYKFKKGVFVKILDNKLKVFLPFNNQMYANEWAHRIQFDPKYQNITDYLRKISSMEGRKFNPNRVNRFIENWYGNNCLVRYEYPETIKDTNMNILQDFLLTLCNKRKLPDIEFFINSRDFPLLTKEGMEPYNHLWDSETHPLVSHNYDSYSPILSMSVTPRYADILMPTWEDWARVRNIEGVWFPYIRQGYVHEFNHDWNSKIPTAVFRGGSTGCYTTIDKNMRLKAALISVTTPPDENGIPYLDAGITKWNLRPRKVQENNYLQTIDLNELPFNIATPLTPSEQSNYKYVLNIDGHVTAYRLSLELSMGSTLLLVNSPWEIWYSYLLQPYIHYVPVAEDLSDLIDQIKWCRDHDSECAQIARNALIFYKTYLTKESILDFMQQTLINTKKIIGVYIYNVISPFDVQVKQEFLFLDNFYPETEQSVQNIGKVPHDHRTFGLLRGVQYIINMVLGKTELKKIAQYQHTFSSNKWIQKLVYNIAGFNIFIKTSDILLEKKKFIHEAFVGQCLNSLVNNIPNFVYTFNYFSDQSGVNIVYEYIPGETFEKYLMYNSFNIQTYFEVTFQLCLALHIAQQNQGFIHWKLKPDKIILQTLKTPVLFNYTIDYKTTIKINTSVIPIITGFSNSHVIKDRFHYGFLHAYELDTSIDILTWLFSTVNIILKNHKVTRSDGQQLLKLISFICPSSFRPPENLTQLHQFVSFFSKRIRYNSKGFINTNPLSLFHYIINLGYSFDLQVSSAGDSIMDRDNERQVFDFSLSNSNSEKLSSFTNILNILRISPIPTSSNMFFGTYIKQQMFKHLKILENSMLLFFFSENINPNKMKKVYSQFRRLLSKIYTTTLIYAKLDPITFEMPSYPHPRQIYTELTFTNPKTIKRLIEETPLQEDPVEYRIMLESVFTNTENTLSHQGKEYYENTLKSILEPIDLKTRWQIADSVTLRILASKIYKTNEELLKKSCPLVQEYIGLFPIE